MISGLLPGPGTGTKPARGVPQATVARLPVYHEALGRLFAGRVEVVSSTALAEAAGVSPSQLRKDLSCLGTYGTRGVGYDVARLHRQIATHIGAASEWPVVIVGVGHLGTALANYAGFAARGFTLVALVDPAPARIGTSIQGITVSALTDLEEVVRNTGAVIAVVATPADAAQEVTDRLVHQGVTSILNFASTPLVVPEGVNVRKVDLGQELAILAFHEQRKVEEVS